MLIPEKLTITNYCQIKNLEIDFSAHQVFAITASNGRGKTNTLNALRFALSGQASPGAAKLVDDIRDQADKAEVTLTFSLNGGIGTIRRVITRKNTECSLKLSINGEEEEYTKTTAAEKRFTSLLGVSPKHISEVIIADQHSIDALLFWPAAERGPKFQRFLHGEIFSEIEKLVREEKKKIILDPLAAERLGELEKTLASEQEKLSSTEDKLTKVSQYLDSPTALALEEKIQQISRFHTYQKEARQAEQEILAIEKEISNSIQRLSQLELLPDEEFGALEHKVETFSATWQQYRPYQQAQALLQTLKPQEQKLRQLTQEVEHEATKQDESTKAIQHLEVWCQQLKTKKEISELKLKLSEKQRQLDKIASRLSEQEKQLETIQREQEKLPIATLHLLQEVFQYMEQHNSPDCIVCGARISSQRIGELKSQQAQYSLHHAKLTKENTQINNLLKTLQQDKTVLVSQIANLEKDIGTQEKSISTTTTLPIELSQEQAEQQLFEAKSRQLAQQKRIAELPAIRREYLHLAEQISNLEKVAPVAAPPINEKELDTLQQELQQERKKREHAQRENLQLSKARGKSEQLQQQLDTLVKSMTQSGLPHFTKVFELSTKESTEMSQLEKARAEKKSLTEEKSGCHGALKTINTQITQAKHAVSRHEEAGKYTSDLEQLEQWFRYSGIPSKIMQRQLNNLCGKMEEIISQFALTRQFRLTVNEDLEVFMLYADGTIRPIHKASGGERMILGIAFRLATHQYLSPELPFLALDEPSNHLVDTNQVVLQEIVRDLKNSLGKYGIRKLVYCTHSRALANEAETIINLDTALKN